MRPNFHEVAGLWIRDGSLRDIYVQETEAVHWDRFDQLLSHYDCSYTFDGVAAQFPGSHSVLENREGSHGLSILLNGPIRICCHFFIAKQLELDISPEDITGPSAHEEVLSFVESLAEALALSADITPENSEQTPFLTYVPQTRTWRIHDHPRLPATSATGQSAMKVTDKSVPGGRDSP